MINIVCGLVCVFFMIFGVVDVIRFFLINTMKIPKNSVDPLMIIPIKGHQEDIEYIIRAAVNQLKWINHQGKSHVVCLDCGMDEETKKICETLCKDYSCLKIQKSDES